MFIEFLHLLEAMVIEGGRTFNTAYSVAIRIIGDRYALTSYLADLLRFDMMNSGIQDRLMEITLQFYRYYWQLSFEIYVY